MTAGDLIGSVAKRLPAGGAGRLRLILVLVIAGLFATGGLLAGRERLRTRSAIDAARHENRALRARQEALREQVFVVERATAGLAAGGIQAYAPEPVSSGTTPARSAAAPAPAGLGTARP